MLKKALILLCLIPVLIVSFPAAAKGFYANKTTVSFTDSVVITIHAPTAVPLNCHISNSSVVYSSWGTWKGSSIKLRLYAKKVGKSTVTVTNRNTGEKIKIKATVKSTLTTGISLSKSKLTMMKGDSATLKCTLKPKRKNPGIKWTSSNSKVVSVNSSGKLTALKSGYAEVSAATTDGSKLKKTCKITVYKKTVGKTLGKNLEYLKSVIEERGEGGIFKKRFDGTYSVLYYPNKEEFEFVWTDDYSETGENYLISSEIRMIYPLKGFDYCTASHSNIYYENGSAKATYKTEITFKTSTYNRETSNPKVKIIKNTYGWESSRIKEYAKRDLEYASTLWDSMMKSELQMNLNDFGFNAF